MAKPRNAVKDKPINGIDDAQHVISDLAIVPIKPKAIKFDPLPPKITSNVREMAATMVQTAFAETQAGANGLINKIRKSNNPEPAAVNLAFNNFEVAVGGRAKLIAILNHCPPASVGYVALQKLLGDPLFMELASTNSGAARVALGEMCHRRNIPFNVVVAAFKDSLTAQIAIDTLMSSAKHVPLVVGQLAEDSQNRWVPCVQCEGVGRMEMIAENGEFLKDDLSRIVTRLCLNCRGKGRVWQKHDVVNRKTFLELVKLTEKKALVENTINTANQFNTSSTNYTPGDGGFERLMKAIDLTLAHKPLKEDEVMDIPFSVYSPAAENSNEEETNAKSEEGS
jgi:hypothetical protein